MTLVAAAIGALLLLLLLRVLITRNEAYPRRETPSGAATASPEESIRELLLRGRKIEAITVYRQAHRVDLKAAKKAVELLARDLPRAT